MNEATMNSNPTTRTQTALRRRALGILTVCTLYIGLQLFMIVRGHFTPSKHFGFWMFPESTYFTASLSRLLEDGREVKTKKGAWSIDTPNGKVIYRWNTFVDGYRMDLLETKQRSKGTFDDTVKYFRAALDYVAARIPEDKSTHQLIMRIEYRRAGGPKEHMVLESKPRLEGPRYVAH